MDDDLLHDLSQVIGSDFQAVNLTPVVSSLSQSSGASSGGGIVTIGGVNFEGVASQLQVSFGGVPATNVQVLSDNALTATVPAGTIGTKVDVTVTTPYGTSATSSADQFTYVAAPTVAGVSPTTGPAASGAPVTITGTNFTGATGVTFGGVPATGITVNAAGTQITAIDPAGTDAYFQLNHKL